MADGVDNRGKIITVYCDGGGGTKHSNFIGGIGVVMDYGERRLTISESYENATNSRMELMAGIRALESLKRSDIPINIYSDSAYVVNCFFEQWYINWRSNGWKNSKKKPVENRDLWERLLKLYESFDDIAWHKVKGHSGVELNELADELATKAIKSDPRSIVVKG